MLARAATSVTSNAPIADSVTAAPDLAPALLAMRVRIALRVSRITELSLENCEVKQYEKQNKNVCGCRRD